MFKSSNDAQAGETNGADVIATLLGFNGASWDRLRVAADNGDALATLAQGVLRVLAENMLFNGSGFDRQRTPAVFKSLSAALVTAETTIWTPAAGKKFRLMGYAIAQGTVTGAVTLRDNTAGPTILVIPQNTVGVASIAPPLGNGILSAAANNVLTAQGASTETITGFVFGTEE